MKPINEYTLQECLEALQDDELFFKNPNYVYPSYVKALASRIHALTRWIPVGEALPEKDETALVKGIRNTELYDAGEEPEIGLVSWDSVQQSMCQDTCYYSVWYSDITHWRRIDTPTPQNTRITR